MLFLDSQENIIFIGNPDVGKTHLSIGLGIETCRQGARTLFINCHELIIRLTKAQEKQHLERVMRRCKRHDLLIIDELGYLPISENGAKLLFQLIMTIRKTGGLHSGYKPQKLASVSRRWLFSFVQAKML